VFVPIGRKVPFGLELTKTCPCIRSERKWVRQWTSDPEWKQIANANTVLWWNVTLRWTPCQADAPSAVLQQLFTRTLSGRVSGTHLPAKDPPFGTQEHPQEKSWR